ncbi:autotransporter domain-containing protein [Sesbania bispinosa]|nr:autotransporter domain-containing protein [Sesbania bispinosa]
MDPRTELHWVKGIQTRVSQAQRPKNVTMMSIRTQWSGRRDLKVEVWWVQGPGKSIEYTDLGVESLRYKDPVDLKIQEQKQKE